MELFAADYERLAFLLETDAALELDFEALEALAGEENRPEFPPGGRRFHQEGDFPPAEPKDRSGKPGRKKTKIKPYHSTGLAGDGGCRGLSHQPVSDIDILRDPWAEARAGRGKNQGSCAPGGRKDER